MGRRLDKSLVKALGLTQGGQGILSGLDVGEETGIPGVAVKCVDIGRNTNGESKSLDHHRRSSTKAGGSNRIRYPGSPSRKRCSLGMGGIDPSRADANALNEPPGEYGRKVETQRN